MEKIDEKTFDDPELDCVLEEWRRYPPAHVTLAVAFLGRSGAEKGAPAESRAARAPAKIIDLPAGRNREEFLIIEKLKKGKMPDDADLAAMFPVDLLGSDAKPEKKISYFTPAEARENKFLVLERNDGRKS